MAHLGSSTLKPSPLRAWTLTLSFSPSDVYVFGVGPLVDYVNINALASKKNNERHVFKVKDMENLEDVFFQMIGRKTQGCVRGSCRLRLPTSLTPKPSNLEGSPSTPRSILISHNHRTLMAYFTDVETEA